jgi:serine protease Do
LKKGDRLLNVADKPVTDATAFLAMARALKPGEKILLAIERDGKAETIELQLARAPAGQPDSRFGFIADFTDVAKDGILLTEVPPTSTAAKAGLQKGDRILALDGEAIRDQAVYIALVRELQPGDTVQFTLSRDGQERQVEVQVAEPPRGPARGNRLGISVEVQDGQEGLLITAVRGDSPAATAGVRTKDRIIALNGHAVKDVADYFQAVRDVRDGDTVELTIDRDGKTLKIAIVVK